MSVKSIPVSFRITREDAAFLAQIEIEGATTLSEKIRGLIAKAQRDQESRKTFAESTLVMREFLTPGGAALDEAERSLEIHSELLRFVLDWLPETMATLITSAPSREGEPCREEMEKLERAVAIRTIRLLENVLRLGITEGCDAYDEEVVATRLGRGLELAELIRLQRES